MLLISANELPTFLIEKGKHADLDIDSPIELFLNLGLMPEKRSKPRHNDARNPEWQEMNAAL
jgi:hypothetical protein